MVTCVCIHERKNSIYEVTLDNDTTLFSILNGPPTLIYTHGDIELYKASDTIFEPRVNENTFPDCIQTPLIGRILLKSKSGHNVTKESYLRDFIS